MSERTTDQISITIPKSMNRDIELYINAYNKDTHFSPKWTKSSLITSIVKDWLQTEEYKNG